MFRLYCVLLGYAFGCIQTSYIAARLMKQIDIREHGSGNAGTTNTLRVMGYKAGAAVLACDCLKAAAAYITASLIFGGGGTFTGAASALPGLYAGLGTVLGHNFPFYLKFKGGKGIASTFGLTLAFDWRVLLVMTASFITAVGCTRFVSLGSLLVTLMLPFLVKLAGHGWEETAVAAALTVSAWIMHRGNIKRLLNKTERKLSFKPSEKESSG